MFPVIAAASVTVEPGSRKSFILRPNFSKDPGRAPECPPNGRGIFPISLHLVGDPIEQLSCEGQTVTTTNDATGAPTAGCLKG
jgi:hypothetical protein